MAINREAYDREVLNDAYALFAGYGLKPLIEKYHLIEAQIVDRLIDTVSRFLEDKGFTPSESDSPRGLLYTKSQKRLSVQSTPLPSERSLSLNVTSHREENGLPSIQREFSLHQPFGLFRSVCLEFPRTTGIDFDRCTDFIQRRLELLYSSLESAFLDGIEELTYTVFRNVYRRLNFHLKNTRREELVGSYFLSIGHEDSFHYFFDREKTSAIIALLKSHQLDAASPFELLVDLMRQFTEFDESLACQSWQEKRTISRKWSELPYRDSKPLFLEAEHLLYGSTGHAVRSLCEARGYVLCVCTSIGLEKDVIGEAVKILHTADGETGIEDIFRSGVSQYSLFFGAAKAFKSAIGGPDYASAFGRFVGAMAGGLIKSSTQ